MIDKERQTAGGEKAGETVETDDAEQAPAPCEPGEQDEDEAEAAKLRLLERYPESPDAASMRSNASGS